MGIQRFFAITALLCAVSLAPLTSVHASSVIIEDNTDLMQGSESFVDSFTVSTPGTLTISLASIPWLDTLSDLQFSLASAGQLVGPSMGAGTESFQIQPGTYSGMLFGDADGKYGLGLFNLELSFQPLSTVPVPPSLLLLLSGVGLLAAGQGRRRVGL